jgi:hypothetical protein
MVLPVVFAAAAVSKIGADIYSGAKRKKALKKQARILDAQARLEEEAAEFDALQAEKQFDQLMGDQRLTAAVSGVESEGSLLDIFRKTNEDKKISAENIRAAGRARASAIRSGAVEARREGREVLTGSLIGAVGSAAQSYSSFKGI